MWFYDGFRKLGVFKDGLIIWSATTKRGFRWINMELILYGADGMTRTVCRC